MNAIRLALTMVLLSGDLSAQALRPIPIKPANGSLDAEFTYVGSVRELSDGRVLISDPREKSLGVGDFSSQIYRPVARKGRGPLEYLFPTPLLALGGDSTLMFDISQLRWIILVADRITGSLPPDHPLVRAVSQPSSVDRFGHVLAKASVAERRPGVHEITRRDSQVHLLVSWQGVIDTVARTREWPHRLEVFSSEGGHGGYRPIATEPNAQAEIASLSGDGTLWIIRQDPLRVDVRDRSGQWTRGTPWTVRGESVSVQERRAIDSVRRQDASELRRLGIKPPDPLAIPNTKPVLTLTSVFLPDGRLAVKRRGMLSAPSTRYLVVNKRGAIDGQITLKPNEDLVGSGARSLYVAVKDADELLTLRRHPWP